MINFQLSTLGFPENKDGAGLAKDECEDYSRVLNGQRTEDSGVQRQRDPGHSAAGCRLVPFHSDCLSFQDYGPVHLPG